MRWRRKTGPVDLEAGGYPLSSRLLHRLALGSRGVRNVLFDLDRALAGKGGQGLTIDRPLFVTGLARAGTTILLEALHSTGRFATLTYRDMPFVLAPYLWNRISRPHRRDAAPRERAHGDGLQVGYDSAESFEEVFWLTRTDRDYVTPGGLHPHEAGEETLRDFRDYIGRILLTRPEGAGRRYLSKNNNNLLRVGSLLRAFPDPVVLIPFRDPAEHAFSLWNQHRRFCRIHTGDRFGRAYMGWLGHFEFGLDHRPFRFDRTGGPGAGGNSDPMDPRYWLEYWESVYAYLRETWKGRVLFFDHDRLCREPAPVLAALAEAAGLSPPELGDRAGRIRNTAKKGAPELEAAAGRGRARGIHRDLVGLSREWL